MTTIESADPIAAVIARGKKPPRNWSEHRKLQRRLEQYASLPQRSSVGDERQIQLSRPSILRCLRAREGGEAPKRPDDLFRSLPTRAYLHT